jgi:hypothetical protein
MDKTNKRSCGDCTKCCEGWLDGNVLGHSFYPGKPCHFVSIGVGCTIYPKRPTNPCVSYKCEWISSEDLPEWFKPNLINTIIDYQTIDGISYMRVVEAGELLQSNVLSWLVKNALDKQINMSWTINGGLNFIGSRDFINAMEKK